MNKTAIKNFAIWARNKLIADITYKAGLLGITEKEIKNPLPQSTQSVQFFNIGTKEPYAITGYEIKQRKKLVEEIQRSSSQSDYHTAFKNVIEEVAYTWFNRLIAVRFMEVNDYLPTGVRVLSSESNNKAEPDLVTHPMEADLDYTAFEKDRIMQLKQENKLDELFRMLFIKQCNELNKNLPGLFEKTTDYTELLLNVTFTDKDGVVFHLVNDIPEDDFNVSKEGQVEIIGWLYQYYNTEPKDETFALLKKNVKITKERVPSATQLFTPDWIVRYMVENSLGRLWLEGRPNDELKSNWKYYLDEAEQEENVQIQLNKIREEYKTIEPEDIKVIDPAMGSGHILVYAFDVLMGIYESYGYSKGDAARSIVEKNLYGLDIDNRAYQLAYFAVMMKARQYNKKILNEETTCHVYAIQESNDINRDQLKYFGAGMSDIEKNTAKLQLEGLLDVFIDAKEYGSILNVDNCDWRLLREFVQNVDASGQMSVDTLGIEQTNLQLEVLVRIGEIMARRYDVVVTNPPYMGNNGMSGKLSDYVKKNYPDSKSDLFAVFIEKCTQMTKINKYQAMITQHAFMFLSSYEKLRLKLILNDFVNMAHLGTRAFEEIGGEVVQTTSFVLRKSNFETYKASFVRLVDYNSQRKKELEFLSGNNSYVMKKEIISRIPGSPIAYWVSEKMIMGFLEGIQLKELVVASVGIQTGDNDKFVRNWWELQTSNICFKAIKKEDTFSVKAKWYPYNKGGFYRKWYGNDECVIEWQNDGENIKNLLPGETRHWQQYADELKFKPMVTWSRVSSGKPSFRKKENGYLSDMAGFSIFSNGGNLDVICAFCNSVVAEGYLKILSPTINFMLGSIISLPIKLDDSSRIQNISMNNIQLSKQDWDSFETSWDFIKHPLLKGKYIKVAYKDWQNECENRFNNLKLNEEELNRIFINLYNLQDELDPGVEDKNITISRIFDSKEETPENMNGSRYALTKQDIIRNFISYAVGCMSSRYSLVVDGLSYNGSELDKSKYSVFVPDKDNIIPITDEEYFKDDIVGLFVAFVKKVYGEETIEENLNFIANALGNKGNSSREIIRNYFIKDFFKDHCKTYQKKPIYWLFDSGKESGFKALVYMHRYDENTIGNLRIDYLHRMQRIYENEIARMQDTIENSKDSREVTVATKRKEKLIKQLKETKEYDEKIAHLALARTAIDLDDGVKVNYEKVQIDVDGKKLDVLAKI